MAITPNRRRKKIALISTAIIIGVPLAALTLVLFAGNLAITRQVLVEKLPGLTGGMVEIGTVSGRFPDALRVGQIRLHDTQGVWLTITNAAIDLSPSALLRGTVAIDRIAAQSILIARAPLPAPTKPTPAQTSTGPFHLPVRVVLASLALDRIDIAAPTMGTAIALKVSGRAALKSQTDAQANFSIERLDRPGQYRLSADARSDQVNASIDIDEPDGGLLGGLAQMHGVGAIAVHGSISGPLTAETLSLTGTLGALAAKFSGNIDVTGKRAKLAVALTAPAMAPRADLSWRGLDVHGTIAGPFAAPDANIAARLDGLSAAGAHIKILNATIAGTQGANTLQATIAGLLLPGAKGDAFAATPIDITAQTNLAGPAKSLIFGVHHRLITADGQAVLGDTPSGKITLAVPDLAPIAALAGTTITGRLQTTITLSSSSATTHDIGITGAAHITGGQKPLVDMLGDTDFHASTHIAGTDLTLHDATITGRKFAFALAGTKLSDALNFAGTLDLTDLSAAAPNALGTLHSKFHVYGAQNAFAADINLAGDIGTQNLPKGPITLNIAAAGLPGAPTGKLTLAGMIDRAAITVDAAVDRATDGTLHANITRGTWKNFSSNADFTLPPGRTIPLGTLTVTEAKLGDFASLLKQDVSGDLRAKIVTSDTAGKTQARIDITAKNLASGANGAQNIALNGTIADLAGTPNFNLLLVSSGMAAAGNLGTAKFSATGPLTALALRGDAAFTDHQASTAHVTTAAMLNGPAQTLTLTTLRADKSGETLALSAPAKLDFASGLAIDQLRATLGAATIDIAGRITPTLALSATIKNITPDLAKPFAPDIKGVGSASIDAKLAGTVAAPTGTLRLAAHHLRALTGPAASLPAIDFAANVALAATTATIDASLDGGTKLHLTSQGTAPLNPNGRFALHTLGAIDLSLLDPIIAANGRRAAGQMAINANLTGTAAKPAISGSVHLTNGEIQDYVQGFYLKQIAASITATGDTITIDSFVAHAGKGTISAHGTAAVMAPDMPVDLHVNLDHATTLSSDLVVATISGDLALTGQLAHHLAATGKILINKAEITIPDGLPATVARIKLRRPGDKPLPAPTAQTAAPIDLDLTLAAPSNIFVRGHGLDAEMGGKLTIGATAAAPDIRGGFKLRRGDFSLAGTTLKFSRGDVGFDGAGVSGKIDPTLDFAADSSAGGVTATLGISGYASAPKIKLSSVPDLPQDEVLAHLLFGTSMKDLSPLQIAQIGGALADIAGVTGGGEGIMGKFRKGLGLDRLSVGGGSGGAGASVEAGRYVMKDVYVGAKQDTSGGGGTSVQIQVDLTDRLKVKASVAASGGNVQGSTPQNDQGTTLGLSYGLEY